MSEPVQNPDAGEQGSGTLERLSLKNPRMPGTLRKPRRLQKPSLRGTVNRYQSLAPLGSSVLAASPRRL